MAQFQPLNQQPAHVGPVDAEMGASRSGLPGHLAPRSPEAMPEAGAALAAERAPAENAARSLRGVDKAVQAAARPSDSASSSNSGRPLAASSENMMNQVFGLVSSSPSKEENKVGQGRSRVPMGPPMVTLPQKRGRGRPPKRKNLPDHERDRRLKEQVLSITKKEKPDEFDLLCIEVFGFLLTDQTR